MGLRSPGNALITNQNGRNNKEAKDKGWAQRSGNEKVRGI